MPLAVSDVAPGLVAQVDTSRLRALGGTRTNAQVTAEEDRAVTGVHDFLVLLADMTRDEVVAIPLFPRSAPGSAPLDDALRTGPASWRATPVYYSRWQHWIIPRTALAAAAADETPPRRYAEGNRQVLQELANWASRNRCAYRPA